MKLKLIQVGVGGRGKHWLEFIAQRDDVETVACVDVDQEALEQARSQRGCDVFTDLGRALSGVAADGVLIASPSQMHGSHATLALDAGLPVLVEKPLAATLAEAVDLVEAARSAGRALMVAENYRFFQGERTLRRALEDGLIGEARSAECIDRRNQPSGTLGPWVKSMSHPFLTEIAVHHFDSFRYFFGKRPVTLWTRTFNPPGSDYERNGAAESLIELEGGFPIQYSGSFVGSRYEFMLSVEGERGELCTNRSRVWIRSGGERRFRRLPPQPMPEGEPLRYPHAGMLSMLAQFRGAIAGGPEPETSGRDNLWTLAMFEAAVRSAAEGRYIAIDEVFTLEMQARGGCSTSGGAEH